jgi:signal transduction histidine kinase
MNYIFVDGLELGFEGLNAADLLGQPYLNRFPPESRNEIKNHLTAIYNGTNTTFDIFISGNHYVIHGVPLTVVGGITDEILLVKQNITKLKEAEENMRMALEKEKLINELKSRFVTLASHEFRTPLSTILSSTELIGEYIEHDGANAALIKEKNLKHLKRIKSSIQNMVSILNSFLSLEQLEQGKAVIHPVNFDVKDFSTEVIDEIKAKLKTGQKIKFTHHSADALVYMDKQMLKNAVLNLLANAIKYSPENTDIKYDTTITAEGLEFTIEDKGIGIPENEQSQLFERFFRAKNTLNIEGTGLGLSIVKKYIDLLNGHISFLSRENEGSTFKVFVANAPSSKQTNLTKQETQ